MKCGKYREALFLIKKAKRKCHDKKVVSEDGRHTKAL